MDTEPLRLENEKLALEIEQLKQPKSWGERLGKALPLLSVLAALVGLLIQNNASNQARLLEAQKPFLEKQLQQYFDVSVAASKIATTKKPDVRAQAEADFWVLYWGPLAVVEDASLYTPGGEVEGAMVRFGDCLDPQAPCSDDELKVRSLDIAHSCRISFGASWDIKFAKLKPRKAP